MSELMVVVGIIAIMGAVAVPSIYGFLRSYAIDSSAKEMASEIQTARYKAISRNVSLGVLLVVLDDSSYRYVVEDDLDLQTAPNWTSTQTLSDLLTRPEQLGPVKRLPTGVRFQAAAPTDPFFRFNRFGAYCQPGVDVECAAVSGFTGTEYVVNTVAGATIRMVQDQTNLARTLRIGTGGRVIIENQ